MKTPSGIKHGTEKLGQQHQGIISVVEAAGLTVKTAQVRLDLGVRFLLRKEDGESMLPPGSRAEQGHFLVEPERIDR